MTSSHNSRIIGFKRTIDKYFGYIIDNKMNSIYVKINVSTVLLNSR